MKSITHSTHIVRLVSIAAILFISSLAFWSSAAAQQTRTLSDLSAAEDPTKSSFKIILCDGPEKLNDASTHMIKGASGNWIVDPSWKPDPKFIPCDFNGAMLTVQHLINVMMVLGVFAAIVLFTYAGYLMMTGKDSDRNKAKDIFPKVFLGFVIMLSAWFIVYQILNWLTGNGIFTKLLGNP